MSRGATTEPGSTDPRGASPPYAPPLADGPGPDGVTLQVPGPSTMNGAYDAESSTDHRWIRAEPVRSAPSLPGGVGISRLRVYDWEGPDGLRGGSPHVHLVCSEAYLVLDGAGAVQTLGPGGFNETPVERGSLLWFTPGLVHRLVNHGDLEIIVLMQIATLPEAGDCILSFPEDVLRDRRAYLDAAGHDPGRSVGAVDDDAARRRRDLAVVGFSELRERMEVEEEQALHRFYELAAGIAAPLVPAWRDAWQSGPAAASERAAELIAALEDGGAPPLAASMFGIDPPAGEVLGLCGRLNVYPSVDGVPVVQ